MGPIFAVLSRCFRSQSDTKCLLLPSTSYLGICSRFPFPSAYNGGRDARSDRGGRRPKIRHSIRVIRTDTSSSSSSSSTGCGMWREAPFGSAADVRGTHERRRRRRRKPTRSRGRSPNCGGGGGWGRGRGISSSFFTGWRKGKPEDENIFLSQNHSPTGRPVESVKERHRNAVLSRFGYMWDDAVAASSVSLPSARWNRGRRRRSNNGSRMRWEGGMMREEEGWHVIDTVADRSREGDGGGRRNGSLHERKRERATGDE